MSRAMMRENVGRRRIANAPVIIRSPNDESMVLSIQTGENIDDKIYQFIQKHDLGIEVFGPIVQHVQQLLEDGAAVSSPENISPIQRYAKPSPREIVSRENISSTEDERMRIYNDSDVTADYGGSLIYSPVDNNIRRLPSEDEEEHMYYRARSQYDDEGNWPEVSRLQPTYNEINMSSNNSLSGTERGRRSRSSSHDGMRARARSLSPSSLGRSRRQDTFQRLFEDGRRLQSRKEEMGLRLDQEMWKEIRKASYRKQLASSPTRHFRFDADRERMFRNSGLTWGEFVYNDHKKWADNREARMEKIRAQREKELDLELKTLFKPNLETSAAMQLPNAPSVEVVFNRLHNSHYFYGQNRTARNEQYENQYKELVNFHIPSINPYSRKLAEARAARKAQLRQQQELSHISTDNRQQENGFFTPVTHQSQSGNALSSSNHKFPSQFKSNLASRMDLHVANSLEHSGHNYSSTDSTTDNNPAALNMELLARLKDADSNTDSGASTAQLNHSAPASTLRLNTTSIRTKSRSSSPLRINTEAPMLNATSVHAHVAHTPMNIAPIFTGSVDPADKQLNRVRSFSHASVGSGTLYELKNLDEVRALSPSIFRDSKDLLISASSANPPTPVSASSRFFVGTASSNNSVVSGLATSSTYRWRNSTSSPLHVRTPSTASVLSHLTTLRRSQQTNSRFHHYATHAPVLPVHERLVQEGIDLEHHRNQLREVLTPQFSFTPSTGRPPRSESDPAAVNGHEERNGNSIDSPRGLDLRALATIGTKKNVFDRLWEKRRAANSLTSSRDGSLQIPFIAENREAPNALVEKLLSNKLTEAETEGVVNRLVGYSKVHDDIVQAQRKKQDENWEKISKGNALSIPKSEKIVRDRQRATLKELFLVLCVSVNYHRAKQQKEKPRQELATELGSKTRSRVGLEAESRAEAAAMSAEERTMTTEEVTMTCAAVAEDEERQLPFRSALVPLDAWAQDEEKQDRDGEVAQESQPKQQQQSKVAWVEAEDEGAEVVQANTLKVQPITESLTVPTKVETRSIPNSHQPEFSYSHPAGEIDEYIKRSSDEMRLNIFLADPTHLNNKELIEAMLYILATFRKEYHQWIKQSAISTPTSEEEKQTEARNVPKLDEEKIFTLLYVSEQAFVARGMQLLQTNVFLPVVASLLAVPPRSKSPVPTKYTGKPVLEAEKKTNQLTQGRYHDRNSRGMKIEDSLLAYREYYEQNLEDLRCLVEEETTKELTFAPALISVYERERQAQKKATSKVVAAVENMHYQQQPQQQHEQQHDLSNFPNRLGANIGAEQSISRHPTLFLSNPSQPGRPENNRQVNAQQQHHRWTSAHWKQQILLHQEERKSIEQSSSFLSSPKFRSIYRAMSSKESEQKPSQKPSQKPTLPDPADSSPFRFPLKVFGSEELGDQRNRQRSRSGRRSRSADASFR